MIFFHILVFVFCCREKLAFHKNYYILPSETINYHDCAESFLIFLRQSYGIRNQIIESFRIIWMHFDTLIEVVEDENSEFFAQKYQEILDGLKNSILSIQSHDFSLCKNLPSEYRKIYFLFDRILSLLIMLTNMAVQDKKSEIKDILIIIKLNLLHIKKSFEVNYPYFYDEFENYTLEQADFILKTEFRQFLEVNHKVFNPDTIQIENISDLTNNFCKKVHPNFFIDQYKFMYRYKNFNMRYQGINFRLDNPLHIRFARFLLYSAHYDIELEFFLYSLGFKMDCMPIWQEFFSWIES